MVNIYLFIELLHTASAVTTVDTLKALSLDNCKFANVVVLSDEKLVAQLDCKDSIDGDKAILNKIAKVDGVVQTNIIAVVRPVKRLGIHEGARLSFPLSPSGRGLSAAILRAKLRKSHGGKGEGVLSLQSCRPPSLSLPLKGRGESKRQSRSSIPVDEAFHALMLGAMDAAIDGVAVLHAMADDAAAAMRADRRERGDGAFE